MIKIIDIFTIVLLVTAGETQSLPRWITEQLALVNKLRADNLRGTVCLSPKLIQAAMNQAQYISNNNQEDKHRGNAVIGVEIHDRVRNVGFNHGALNENWAPSIHQSAEAVIAAWNESPGHRNNMLAEEVTHVGFGGLSMNDPHGGDWVQVFAEGINEPCIDDGQPMNIIPPPPPVPAPASAIQAQPPLPPPAVEPKSDMRFEKPKADLPPRPKEEKREDHLRPKSDLPELSKSNNSVNDKPPSFSPSQYEPTTITSSIYSVENAYPSMSPPVYRVSSTTTTLYSIETPSQPTYGSSEVNYGKSVKTSTSLVNSDSSANSKITCRIRKK